MTYPQSMQNFPLFYVEQPVWPEPDQGPLTFPFCTTVWQCCVRDASRAGFRGSVVGAIFFVSSLSVFFFEVRFANLPEGEGRAKRASLGLS
ncbi:hypothetical protein [Janthinobacterium sp. ROICE36]|uniref:hypothetical protein n=1 Tax=Janthinobacterium sp. ROICE36 TaxID=2048670 RepID=UPI0011AEEFE5|nr:hypothetical protein [Janthinobacterium sp. ROICE36]